ncbi:unnamed protein product [Closterium sp. NIES-64]|nr:unnamed protein product [Closterium sp. NIES-64]
MPSGSGWCLLGWGFGGMTKASEKSTSHHSLGYFPVVAQASRVFPATDQIWLSLWPQLPPGLLALPFRAHPACRALSPSPALVPEFLLAGFPPLPPLRVLAAASAALFLLGDGQSRSPALLLRPPPRLSLRPPPVPLFRGADPLRSPYLMTGRRRPPWREVIVAAGSPAAPTLPAAPGGQVPALFRAVADCLTAGVGAASSSSAPARPREPVYCSPRGLTYPFLRARGHSFRRRRPPRPPLSGQARPRPQLHAPATRSQPLQLPSAWSQSASSRSEAPAQSAPLAPLPQPPPLAPESALPPVTCPSVPVPPPPQPDSAPLVGAQAHPPTSAPEPDAGAAPPPPQPSAPPHAPPASGPTPVAPLAYSYPPRLDLADLTPLGPRGLPLPVPAPHGPQPQHPLVPGSRLPAARLGFVSYPRSRLLPALCVIISLCLESPAATGAKTRCLAPLMTLSPPWGEPRPGDGAYQSRGMHLAEVGRCVTELSFVLDLLHGALHSREVVARDPQMKEDQQGRVRRAVSSALWDVLHLPLEPADPLLDDGTGAATFRLVAKAAEESRLGIVPAIACVLR